MKDCKHLATQLRHERAQRGLTQEQLATALIERFALETEVKSLMRAITSAEDRDRRFVRTPPTVALLAAFYGWPADAVDRVLAGGPPFEVPIPREVKDEWRRQVLASDKLSNEAKLRNLTYIESMPIL